MKKLIFSLMLLAVTATAQTGTKSESSSAKISAVRDAYVAAFNAKDADKVASLYAPDAVLNVPDGVFNGREAIRGYLKQGFTQDVSDLKVTSTKTSGDADFQWDTGDYSEKMGGQEVKGRYLVNLKMIGGKWLIVAHADVVQQPH